MDFRKRWLSLNEAKEIDMVDYLSSLGYKPIKIRGNNYWYLSPLREEHIPSFKINRKLNRWYDHGMGKGGNLIDFAILYHHCTISELLKKINDNFSFQKPLIQHKKIEAEPENRIKILRDFNLTSYPLIRYLEQRHISLFVAEKYCREVCYELNKKTYYGISFKNDLGGWEIRNPYFKAGSSPKDITTLKNNTKEVIVFEGFMDFLSFKTIHQNKPENKYDFVILNSVSFFEKARPFMEKHQVIRLYLDRDKTGQNCIQYACSLSKKYKDESKRYQNYKDLNDWLMNFGKSQKHRLRQKLR